MDALNDDERLALIEQLDRARTGFGLRQSFTGEAKRTSPTCGDEITVRVTVRQGELAELSWTGHGCTVSQASAGALAALAPVPLERFALLTRDFLGSVKLGGESTEPLADAEAFAGIGRFPLRARCASLAWLAALDAAGLSQTDT